MIEKLYVMDYICILCQQAFPTNSDSCWYKYSYKFEYSTKSPAVRDKGKLPYVRRVSRLEKVCKQKTKKAAQKEKCRMVKTLSILVWSFFFESLFELLSFAIINFMTSDFLFFLKHVEETLKMLTSAGIYLAK